ncbi:MAG: multiple monosaccharide ABC transporter ATP-binding protein [Candidatus Limiplasma sp.]|nr:multiple monosaccharide ABC transporter ATP-binding protein [Candidatus Limiplasma sp.]
MGKTILKMQNITKVFPGVKALDQVNIEVEEAEIHAICGENGAGKSTLMNVLSGIYPFGSYEGEVIYQGQECRFHNIKDSERKGIVIIHQELALVPYLSIAENMFLGNERQVTGVINWDVTNRMATEYLSIVGLHENPRTLIKDIGMGKQQLVEIAKALAKDVKLLILDEPTSSLNESDAKNLLDLLLKFKHEKGITSILISHKLNELSYCADKITVIRDGHSIETLVKGRDEISEARIIKGMVGREMTNRFPPREHHIGDMALEIRNWTAYHPLYAERKVVDNASLTLRRGEVVGIAGLIGAGRTELAMSVFGHAYGTHITGELFKDGKPIELRTIPQAIQAGLAYVTEDRKGNGLIIPDSIKHNFTLARPQFISERGILDKDLEVHKAKALRQQLGVKAPTVEQLVGNLSGGNQQKVLVGKWIFAEPDVLILDEPTRGVDVGAKYEIYQIINNLVTQGKAVLMISSELPELLGMCDRIYVMNEGRMIAELTAQEASQESIMGYIMQDSKKEIGA